ncbi:hypothetical protein CNX70_16410 [Janthinobacterium svalbardensis]|uniref:Uncharacterized protein n=1 Tax=Janthinobacterium svalbardensis TaxID=368607 RepID=A0A290WXG7_9BURK|nr:hypothetical protein CNX70_16410 [Janthinobacterium svalbardensis]
MFLIIEIAKNAMMHFFLAKNRAELERRCRDKVARRPWRFSTAIQSGPADGSALSVASVSGHVRHMNGGGGHAL